VGFTGIRQKLWDGAMIEYIGQTEPGSMDDLLDKVPENTILVIEEED